MSQILPIKSSMTLPSFVFNLGPSAETPEQKIDYDFAQTELMMQECGDDPIQEAIEAIEKQHVEDKAGG